MPNTAALTRTTPEAQGVASSAILQFVEAVERQLHDLHSFMLLRHGAVVAEGWWSPYRRTYPHRLYSVSKSFTATAVGLALAEGRFALDDAVLAFFPDHAPAAANDFLAALRVRHLLTMSTGHAVDTWTPMMQQPDGDWLQAFLDLPLRHPPGSHFLYNTGASYMLAAIVQQTTAMKLIDYLESRLFAPLGIDHATWDESPQGIAAGGIGLSLTTEAIARFGQLYLQKGVWQGQQLLPEAWVTAATAAQIANGDDPESDWAQGYGYQFWRSRHNTYRADGVFGQVCLVMPEQDAVLAITGGIDVLDAQASLNLVWELLLPALLPAALPPATPAGGAAQQALTDKLAALTLPPVTGVPATQAAAQLSGQTYALDANPLEIETLSLTFSESGCILRFSTANGAETIPCGYAEWQHGETRLFNETQADAPAPVAASGAWAADDRYTVRLYRTHTPFFHTLVFHIIAAEMIIEVRGSLSLDASDTLLLTAQHRESLAART